MTIENEITRIKTNISNAYDICENKGADIPTNKNSDNLADCIDSITVGSGTITPSKIEEGEFCITVIDYDGTVLKQAYLNEGDTFTLPAQPKHSKLKFVEWVSPVPIVDNKIVVPEQPIVIGAQYDTKSGLTEVDVVLTPATGKTVYFKMVGEKNWGDGTIDSETSHTYENYGEYEITTASSTTDSSMFTNTSRQNLTITAIRFANISRVSPDCLSNLYALKSISFNSELSVLCTNSISNCEYIKSLVIPSNCRNDSTTDSCFCRNCSALKYVVYSKSFIAELSQNSMLFSQCYSLRSYYLNPEYSGTTTTLSGYFFDSSCIEHLYIPRHFSALGVYFFKGISGKSMAELLTVDLEDHTELVALQSSSISRSYYLNVKIYVKPKLAKSYTTATNWAVLADYIVYKQFTLNCNITGAGLVSAKLNNKELVNGENIITGYDCPPQEDNCITVKIDGKDDYVVPFDFSSISDDDVYTFNLDLDSLQRVTLTLNNLSTENAIYTYKVNNVQSDITSNTITVWNNSKIDYNISCLTETELFLPMSDTITIIEDKTLDITMTEAQWSDWSRPTFTSSSNNGTLGGDKFGIYAYQTEQSLPSSNSWYLCKSSNTSFVPAVSIIIYNPNRLKVSAFTINSYNSMGYRPNSYEILGSDDNVEYTQIREKQTLPTSSSTVTATIDAFYANKYIKLLMSSSYGTPWLYTINMTGKELVAKTTDGPIDSGGVADTDEALSTKDEQEVK